MDVPVDEDLLQFCKLLPKVVGGVEALYHPLTHVKELHAHINGSISESTIKKLLAMKESELTVRAAVVEF